MAVPITAVFGAINAVLNVALAANVSRVRAQVKVFLGTGESHELLKAARRHGNNAEYVPLALVGLLLAELNGGGVKALYGLGIALTVGRIIHALAIDKTPNPVRALGIVLTWASVAGAAVYAAYLGMH